MRERDAGLTTVESREGPFIAVAQLFRRGTTVVRWQAPRLHKGSNFSHRVSQPQIRDAIGKRGNVPVKTRPAEGTGTGDHISNVIKRDVGTDQCGRRTQQAADRG